MARPTLADVQNLLHLDPETGALRWLRPLSSRTRPGDLAGSEPQTGGRRVVVLNGAQIPAHHIVWLLSHGHWPTSPVKFRDGDATNLTPSNLYLRDEGLSQSPKAVAARKRLRRYRDAIKADEAWRNPPSSNVSGVRYDPDTRLYTVHVWRDGPFKSELGRYVVAFSMIASKAKAEALAIEIEAGNRYVREHRIPVLLPHEALRTAGPHGIELWRLHQILCYNPATGALIWRETPVQRGFRADKLNTVGKRVVVLFQRTYPAKLLAWFLAYGVWPDRKSIYLREPAAKGRDDENRLDNLFQSPRK